jgi:hypothetical protein
MPWVKISFSSHLLIHRRYVQTNLSLNAVRGDGSPHGIMDSTTANGLTAEYVARRTLDAVECGEKQLLLASPSAVIGGTFCLCAKHPLNLACRFAL